MAMTTVGLSERVECLDPAYRHTVFQAVVKAEEQAIDDFAKRVQDLPPELFVMVKEFSFLIERAKVTVDRSYQPPSILQVDRRSRRKLSTQYFSQTMFCVDNIELMCQWSMSLEKLKFSGGLTLYAFKEIRFDTQPGLRDPTDDNHAASQGSEYSATLHAYGRQGELPLNVVIAVFINVVFPSDGKEVWTKNPYSAFMARRDGRD